MKTNSCFTYLVCSQCHSEFDPHVVQTFCQQCHKPLLAVYDLSRTKNTLRKSDLLSRRQDLWRYRELLPVFDTDNIVSMGEGCTPLIQLTRSVAKSGFEHVWVKDESQIPTGSFKARGLAMAVSKAKELGVNAVAIPTAGNAGGALAAYAARAGMECHIFMPEDTPRINYIESKLAGANVTKVQGVISDCGKLVAEKKDEMGWFDVSTLKEPYRIEGKKTMGLELAERFNWRLPDVIVYPTGGGTGLIGMWKAFQELQEMEWIDGPLPRMIAVQSTGCEPITRAYQAGKFESDFFENAQTLASGLRVPKAFGDTLILRALHESGGTAVSVSDGEILDSMQHLWRLEGINICPEGAATWAAIRQLREKNDLTARDRIVLFNTGSGLKYLEVLSELAES